MKTIAWIESIPSNVDECPHISSKSVIKLKSSLLLYYNREDTHMTDFEYHARLAREQRDAALTEHEHKRYSTVGHLALMAAEQAIEAMASREGKHFHEHPRGAHQKRLEWTTVKYPDSSNDLKRLWGIRAELGYGGADGNRAIEAIMAMGRILDELGI